MRLYRGENWYKRDNTLDTSPYTGHIFLSPTLGEEERLKKGVITYEQYKENYIKRLEYNLTKYKDKLLPLLYQEEVILTCCCSNKRHECHNEILAEYISTKYDIIQYKGIYIKDKRIETDLLNFA